VNASAHAPTPYPALQDLTQLRNNNNGLADTIIVDNSPMAYMFQPDNAIDCTSWLEASPLAYHYCCAAETRRRLFSAATLLPVTLVLLFWTKSQSDYMFQPDNAIDCTSWLEASAPACHYSYATEDGCLAPP
jgi:TFIIF-interacting CTD phosphatase-like protein